MMKIFIDSSSEKGQSSVLFALLVPMFVVAMIFSVDFGRFLVLQNQTRIYADGAAVAAAQALDVSRFTSRKANVLNANWANYRASQIIESTKDWDPELSDMTFAISNVDINGNKVTVTVVGHCPTMWSKPFGVGAYTATVTSSARAATGISSELP